ncbi:hypothetical protein IT403_02655 [Candidatus Nomurabacteria bacterium]|nr:hypothetical protein [Candidatus Nomurabacteria bacterium]
MKNIIEDKKIDILISALEERYQAMHNIRDRVQNTGIWILGILGSIGGWIIQSDISFSCIEKKFYILTLFITFIVIRFEYLKDLNKGFKGQQRTTAKIEKSLGFFTPKFFSDEGDSMYPKSWEHAGTEKGDGAFFRTTYLLIYIGFLFVTLAILMN